MREAESKIKHKAKSQKQSKAKAKQSKSDIVLDVGVGVGVGIGGWCSGRGGVLPFTSSLPNTHCSPVSHLSTRSFRSPHIPLVAATPSPHPSPPPSRARQLASKKKYITAIPSISYQPAYSPVYDDMVSCPVPSRSVPLLFRPVLSCCPSYPILSCSIPLPLLCSTPLHPTLPHPLFPPISISISLIYLRVSP
ncbi:hypothetical protein K439DRAFT_147570 [Ramaria rubella]|nr:hypothetical protein K439DRAFT_147570 [Ramaria rubella]